MFGKTPGDAHQRVTVLGTALTRDPPPSVQGGRLVERGGQTCCRVEVFGIGKALDWQTVRSKGGRPDRRDAGKRGQHLPVGQRQELADLGVKFADVGP